MPGEGHQYLFPEMGIGDKNKVNINTKCQNVQVNPMKKFLLLLLLPFALMSCDAVKQPDQKTSLSLHEATFSDLPNWNNDDIRTAHSAFLKSCTVIQKQPSSRSLGSLKQAGTIGDWTPICAKARAINLSNPAQLRGFYETHFTPHQVMANGQTEGLFTGYYEASLNGSRTRTPRYNIPLYTRPSDLVMVQLGDFRDDLKGRRIAGRVVNGRLKPYEDRTQIVSGAWPHNDKALVWVDDAVDAFFVQIQGSGLVTLPDGQSMRIGYAGQNGHPYYAIGRELVKRGALTKEAVSMQSIRGWLADNPRKADEVMNTNASYVFFQELSTKGGGPVGGQNVALTPERSLAIDHSLMAYGLPVWVDIDPPTPETRRLQQLMIAQDTGGAIRGPVRGDVFWGHGARAETWAGAMKSKGRYWVLLPK
jgi:membrane-bound lytic murein transglycosylase A